MSYWRSRGAFRAEQEAQTLTDSLQRGLLPKSGGSVCQGSQGPGPQLCLCSELCFLHKYIAIIKNLCVQSDSKGVIDSVNGAELYSRFQHPRQRHLGPVAGWGPRTGAGAPLPRTCPSEPSQGVPDAPGCGCWDRGLVRRLLFWGLCSGPGT